MFLKRKEFQTSPCLLVLLQASVALLLLLSITIHFSILLVACIFTDLKEDKRGMKWRMIFKQSIREAPLAGQGSWCNDGERCELCSSPCTDCCHPFLETACFCDGSFYVSTLLGHGVSRYLAKHYSGCVCEGGWINILISRLSKPDFPPQCGWV